MIEVILLAIALSMDAFAVAIGLGAKSTTRRFGLALQAGLYFGVFQAVMPLLGYLGGSGIFGWIEDYAHWVAFLLLAGIGGKMIHESLSSVETDAEDASTVITHRVLLLLAIATSIDALAAGFTLTLLAINPWLACVLIGLTTFGFSYAGVLLGARGGGWLEGKAALFGGVVLALIGVKMLLAGSG